jgi:N-acetylglucosamine kinase-like BadF-type ATPase
MSERSSKTFDCVESMRQVRDKLSAEIEGMSYDELVRWLRSRRYTDPVLQRLAEKAARQADAADRRSASR